MITTGFSTLLEDEDKILTGEESWPILGDTVDEKKVAEVIKRCAGMNRIWECIPKAKMCREVLGKGIVAMGSLMVTSGDLKSEYGFYFNPPFELHAWVFLPPEKGERAAIVDVALPGIIEKGLTTHDTVGPYLVNRDPVVLAGRPPTWLRYQWFQTMEVEK